MSVFYRVLLFGLFCLLTGLQMPSAWAVDRAIVIGVNHYPKLGSMNGTTPDLHGCVSDAQSMAYVLRKFKFQVTVLTDAQATRAGMRAAFQKTAKSDRFVFFFAGHGDRSSERGAILLPHDALETSARNDVTANELHQWVKAVPATRRTVLLDSCFSGGMLRSAGRHSKGLRPLKTRFHPRQIASATGTAKPNSKALATPATGADSNSSFNKTDSTVCYFTATRENEQAGEYDFNGKRRGAFTFYLIQVLTSLKPSWGSIQSFVSGKVSDHSNDEQHPTLSPGFVDTVVFDAKRKTVPVSSPSIVAIPQPTTKPQTTLPVVLPPAKPHSLWDDYNTDRVDASKLFLTMKPDKTTVRKNELIEFSASVQAPGYLVILEKGTSGNINLLFPAKPNADDAFIAKGSARRVPADGFSFAPDTEGSERIRAILFTSKTTAQKLLDGFAEERSRPREQWSKDLVLVETKPTIFYTSDFTFEVVADD